MKDFWPYFTPANYFFDICQTELPLTSGVLYYKSRTVLHTRGWWKFSLADIKKIFCRSDVGSKSSHVLVVAAWNIFPIHSLVPPTYPYNHFAYVIYGWSLAHSNHHPTTQPNLPSQTVKQQTQKVLKKTWFHAAFVPWCKNFRLINIVLWGREEKNTRKTFHL